jgi:hypothetical protein
MSHPEPEILEELRLPTLLRAVCLRAGVPLPPDAGGERYVVRCGGEPPGFIRDLLEEALVEDGAEVSVWPDGGAPGPAAGALPAGHVAVRPGFSGRCPEAALRTGLGAPTGKVLLLAVERFGDGGRPLGVTWAALPEGEPAPLCGFRAAVLADVVSPADAATPWPRR